MSSWLKKPSPEKEKEKKITEKKSFPPPHKENVDFTRLQPFYTFKRWVYQWKNLMSGRKLVCVNMELNSGHHSTMLVVEKEGGFTYQDREYTFDDALKYYNYDLKLWCFDYHQSLSMPIKRKINVKKIKDSMTAAELDDIEYATNPSTLKKFLVSKVIEMILKGAELDRWMRMMFWICLFSLIVSAVTLLLMLGHSGIFQQIAQGAKPPA